MPYERIDALSDTPNKVERITGRDDAKQDEEHPQDDHVRQPKPDACTEDCAQHRAGRKQDEDPSLRPIPGMKAGVHEDGHRDDQHHQTKAGPDGATRRKPAELIEHGDVDGTCPDGQHGTGATAKACTDAKGYRAEGSPVLFVDAMLQTTPNFDASPDDERQREGLEHRIERVSEKVNDDGTRRRPEHGKGRQAPYRWDVDEPLAMVDGTRTKGDAEGQQEGHDEGGRVQRPACQVVEDGDKQHPSAQTERCKHERRQKDGEEHHEEGVHVPTYMASMTMAMP